MRDLELETVARLRRGEWRQGVPGALALLAGIGFAVGIVDPGMRELLPDVLALCAVLALVFGALWWLGRRSLSRAFVVGRDGAGSFVRLEGHGELRAPLSYRHGWYREHVEAGVARANVVVLFVAVEGGGGPRMVVRKALGAAFGAPADWAPSIPRLDPTHVLLDIEQLPRALDAIGATRGEP